MQRFGLPGKKPRGRPKRKFMDVIKEDMRVDGVNEEDAEERIRLRRVVCHGYP